MEYDDNEYDLYGYDNMRSMEDEDDDHNDAPTVVIDSSMDEKDYAAEFRRIDSNDDNENNEKSGTNTINNI